MVSSIPKTFAKSTTKQHKTITFDTKIITFCFKNHPNRCSMDAKCMQKPMFFALFCFEISWSWSSQMHEISMFFHKIDAAGPPKYAFQSQMTPGSNFKKTVDHFTTFFDEFRFWPSKMKLFLKFQTFFNFFVRLETQKIAFSTQKFCPSLHILMFYHGRLSLMVLALWRRICTSFYIFDHIQILIAFKMNLPIWLWSKIEENIIVQKRHRAKEIVFCSAFHYEMLR